MKTFRRHSWRVLCPDGVLRAFPKLTKQAACETAFQKTIDGCRPFHDDPVRWWKRKCPGGKHLAVRARRR